MMWSVKVEVKGEYDVECVEGVVESESWWWGMWKKYVMWCWEMMVV